MPQDSTKAADTATNASTHAADDALITAPAQTATDAAPAQATIDAAAGGTSSVAESIGKVAEQTVTAPMPMESAFTWSGYIQALGTLLILLAALWGVVWLVRKYGRFNFMPRPGAFPRDGLRLESQLPLGPRKGLMVVRFLNKRLLLGVTDHQITLLKETADDDDENNMDFKDVMEKAQRQKSDGEF